MPSFTLVTAAPPTPNGDLHLGHLSGPYSGADIHIRAHRLRNNGGLFLTGSDVHQSYVPTKARRDGADPLEMAAGFADEIARIFASAGFAPDSYVRPQHSELHRTIVREFFGRLHARGALRARTEPALFCGDCDRYLFEAHLTGKCPHCGAASDGNSCENCALPNQCTDLVDPLCNACGGTPVERPVQRLVFPLSEYADQLRAFHAATDMSPQLEALCADMIERGLPDIPVSHPTDWGIEMPVPGFEDQRIYVWAEMMPGYFAELAEALHGAGQAPESWRTVWNDPDTEIVQFFGFDNGYFHALLQPALLMAYDPSYRLPRALVTNEFYQLGTSKFSTSRRHAIWANDLLAAVPADAARFVLSHDRPENERTSFSWARFHELVDTELAGTWQHWLTGLFSRIEAQADGLVPQASEASRSQAQFLRLLDRIAEDCLLAYSAASFSPRRATRILCELVRCAQDFAAGQTRTREAGSTTTALAYEAAAARTLAQLAYPVMPEFAERLWTSLGEEGSPRWDGVQLPTPGRPVETRTRFFEALPANIEEQVMQP
ncbi:class I tRNA ligase family protein [Kitasatospora sp. MAP5-34]|uniref:methionine--tRNA ligase n=1 Tax=Kitasatospora sp. MAP5-34 TaxID=3035102 RepID=UPI002473FB2C|nr:class I tRNA ligase family protein [Kitasatospora sp. MAP5-34]MDH6575017.1 methionyl-tRNA synthetase [Kitasatospora sp. MAP5-34]